MHTLALLRLLPLPSLPRSHSDQFVCYYAWHILALIRLLPLPLPRPLSSCLQFG